MAEPKLKNTIKAVALPSEHGGWGFLLEPLVLGLLVAPSWQGFLLGIAALGVFLVSQPVKIALKDRGKEHRTPRIIWAERFGLFYALLAVVPMLILVSTAPLGFLLPVLLGLPLAAIKLYYDSRNQSRQLLPEVAGAAALAMTAPAIAMLGGWSFERAWVLWLLIVLRGASAIIYVRTRLLVEHGKPYQTWPSMAAHSLAMLAALALVLFRHNTWVVIVVFAVLAFRAWLGLSPYRQPRPAKIIGFQEIGYGLFTAIGSALSLIA